MPQCSTGELVKAYRLVSGLSQSDFASRAGISKVHLAFVECGRRQPSQATLEKIARTFSAEFLKSHVAA